MGYDYKLIEEGHEPAVWMSELDMESNSGAHLNSSKFVMCGGKYEKPMDNGKPQFSGQTSINWAGADSNPM